MKINKLKFLFRCLFFPLIFLYLIIFKQKNVWVFGSIAGNKFCDNSKYLFEYVSQNTKCKAVWLTKNDKLINRINEEKKICYHFYSLRGIYYALVAKYIFLSYSYNDVSFFCYLFPLKLKIIQLFHGTPLKNLGIEKRRPVKNRIARSIFRFYIGRSYDLIISTSEIAKKKLDMYFNVGNKKFLISGYPRNDILFKKNKSLFLSDLKSRIHFDKVAFYLPTYRAYSCENNKFSLFDNFKFDQKKLNYILEINDAILLVKLHFRDYVKAKNIVRGLKDSERIYFVKDEEIDDDIYPLLAETDVLITDYSSVYFDFLLLNRPIIFSSFDRVKYEKEDRGFYFDYDKVTPGPNVKNWDELCDKLDESFTFPNLFENERIKLSKYFNKFNDGRSSERVFNSLNIE